MAAAIIEGQLRVRIGWDGQRIVEVDPITERPLAATRAVVGLPSERTPETVGKLFSLCGHAQQTASSLAIEAAATGCRAAPERRAVCRVAAEAALELLWRLCHVLPGSLGRPSRLAELAGLKRLERAAATAADPAAAWRGFAVALGALLGTSPDARDDELRFRDWLDAGASPLAADLAALEAGGYGEWGRSATPLLPLPADESLPVTIAAELHDREGFAAAPEWSGGPAETGPLASAGDAPLVAVLRACHGHTVLVRHAARLVELQRLRALLDGLDPGRPIGGGLPLGDGSGVGWVETARGLLLHRVELDRARRIADYRILAPTEWNFHPAGALAGGLEAQPCDEPSLRTGVGIAITALDPCVDYQVAVERSAAALPPGAMG